MTGSKDYPTSQQQYNDTLRTETGCRAYLTRLRWPKGFICPAPECGSKDFWISKRGLFVCAKKGCQRQTSVTSGTQLEGLSVPLHEWFEIIWCMAWQRRATTVVDVTENLTTRIEGSECERTSTAWRCLRALRRIMARCIMAQLKKRPLHGTVEIGHTVVTTRGGRKHIVLIAAEWRGRYKTGLINLARVPEPSAAELQIFVQKSVRPQARVVGTGWEGCAILAESGYRVETRGSGELKRADRVIAELQTWFTNDHQGSVREQNLDDYLAEFAYLFNGRRNWNPGKTFYLLLKAAVTQKSESSSDASNANEDSHGTPSMS